jgi:glycosyltransferase involved in cell wall biosynthesis
LTEFAKQKFLASSLKVDHDKISIKPNFTFKQNKMTVGPREDFFILISRLEHTKGVETALESFLATKLRLLIIGSGPLQSHVEEIASKNENIMFLGPKENSFCLQKIAQSRALIFPTLLFEGFPMVIVESFATGTPVICSKIGSASEIIADGVNGYHFTPGNAEDLSEKVKKLFYSQPSSTALYTNAYQSYIEKYSEEANHNQLISIYQNAIKRNR